MSTPLDNSAPSSTPSPITLEQLANASPELLLRLQQQINTNPEIKRELVSSLTSLRPSAEMERRKVEKHWRLPYYRLAYGKELLSILDQMIVDGEDKEFLFKSFRTIRPETLRCRVAQSLMFVEEQLDTLDKKYSLFIAKIEVQKTPRSIRIARIDTNAEPLVATSVSYFSTFEDVMDVVKSAIEQMPMDTELMLPDSDMAPFELTEQHQEALNMLVSGFEFMHILMTRDSIKLVKASPNGH